MAQQCGAQISGASNAPRSYADRIAKTRRPLHREAGGETLLDAASPKTQNGAWRAAIRDRTLKGDDGEMTDELNEPLGLARGAPASPRRRLGAATLPLAVALFAVTSYAAYMFVPRDPFGGEPHAIARIEPAKARDPAPAAPQPASAAPGEHHADGRDLVSNATEIEQMSGVKVTRSGTADAPGAMIIQLDRPAGGGIRLTPAPDRRLVEKGRYGPLPKIGEDGARSMDIYSRPLSLPPKLKAAPRVVIVIGGLGLNASVSANAIAELPEAVTLAFAPYGASVEQLSASARERGHETLLQLPMEPFDYPSNNPGPHTLLASAPGETQMDDLYWLMSRFAGYAGVMNFLGARFTADEKALTRALAEISSRGLFVFDDGTSPQSLIGPTAAHLALPAVRADIVLDEKEGAASLDAALAQLELRARDKGLAVGFANALPATITRVARFARDLERRGIALAPLSATFSRAAFSETRTAPQSK